MRIVYTYLFILKVLTIIIVLYFCNSTCQTPDINTIPPNIPDMKFPMVRSHSAIKFSSEQRIILCEPIHF
jgi:hypothetical protein